MQQFNTWSFDPQFQPRITENVSKKHTELFVASNKGLFGIVDPYFGWVISPTFREIKSAYKGSFWGRYEACWQLYNLRNELISDKKFVAVSTFKNNFACASLDGLSFGFVDKEGRFVIPPIYQSGKILDDNYFAVQLNNKFGIIDIYGRILVSFIYSSLEKLPSLK